MYALILELVGKGGRWELANREIRIGRDPNCDLVLPTGDYPMVSRSHLLIRLVADRYWVEDLNTPGGTFVNGAQVQVSPLSDGDVLRLGVSGPELRVSIIPSFRLGEGSEAQPRRQSASQEEPTWSNRGITDKTSHGIPVGEEFMPAASTAEELAAEIAPPERPGAAEEPPAAVPEVPEGKATYPAGAPVSAPGQAASAPPLAEPASTPATPEAALRKTSPPKTPPAVSTSGAPEPAAAVKPSTTEKGTIEQKLKTIRNLLIAALVLTVALWFVVMYHLGK